MLTKIREKSQGVFAWVILLLICVPFALWGIQNYLGGGSEPPVVVVGDKEFFERDINNAYAQFAQSLAGMNFDEALIKKQAVEKLINDEVLWQYVQDKGLMITNQTAREFVQTLEFLQTDGKFDKTKYKALLASQRLTPAEFTARIKKALAMEQMQKTVMESSFATKADVERFFAIQNQTRDIEYVKISLPNDVEEPSEQALQAYYEQHKDQFQIPQQVKIEYVELNLAQLADQVQVTDDELKTYYQEHKAQYTVPERRRISHILFKFNKDPAQDQQAFERALKAKTALKDKDFAELAAEVSDDKLTAKQGGDLGYFTVGIMDQAFEDAAKSLKEGEVSEPVKSAFGYHLIKVTKLEPEKSKAFEQVKAELAKKFQREQAESRFYELAELMAEVSYETPDNLLPVAEAIGTSIKTTEWFTPHKGQGIAAEEAIRSAAFSEEVLKGNNSEPVELGSDRVVVLRVLEHKPAQPESFERVKNKIVQQLKQLAAQKAAEDRAKLIKQALLQGQTLGEIAKKQGLNVSQIKALARASTKVSLPVKQAVFKAAKPLAGKPTIIVASDIDGSQFVISLNKVTPGTLSDKDKLKIKLAMRNIAKAYGQTEFGAFLKALRERAEVQILKPIE
jgi:peptidyl-prolyl cis-trans isomerase D